MIGLKSSHPLVDQLTVKITLMLWFLTFGLLIVSHENVSQWNAMYTGFYLLVSIPLIYAAVGYFLYRLLHDGSVTLSRQARQDTQLARDLARLQLTTHSILNSSTQGIFGLDTEGVVTFLNPAMCKMLGYSEEELTGYSHHEKVHHHYADGSPYPREDCPIYLSLKSGVTQRGEEDYICKDGSYLPVEFVCSPMWENNIMIGAVVFFLDISERRLAEQKQKLASSVFENVLEGLIVTDSECGIVSVNPAFTRITGFNEQDVIGQNPRILKSDQQTDEFYRLMWSTIEETGRWAGEIINRHKNGENYPYWLNITQLFNGNNEVTHFIGTYTDIRQLKASQQQLLHLAHHDALTHLPNRNLFNDRLHQAIKRAHREDCQVAILFLDLDHFKHVNDTLGHSLGDEMLRLVASRLQQQLREGDTVARLGGDEFIVLLDKLDETGDAALVARKLSGAFERPFVIEGRELYVGASIGISLYPEDGKDADTLVKNADVSMYKAKEMGRNNYQFYTEKLTRVSSEMLQIGSELRHALELGQMEVYYQPQVSLHKSKIYGAEALLRWNHPDLGMVSPAKFIPIAEESGLILSIGEWVLNQACMQAKLWHDENLPIGWVAVNISGVQVRRSGIVDVVNKALNDSGLPAHKLELELTESFIMGQAEHSIDILNKLKQLGVSMSIDDFGTGYSSLSYLQRLPIDRLKIDQSFLVDVPQNENNAVIVRAIIALGQSLQLPIIAEGVETVEQQMFLNSTGCELAQGYLYSKPISATEFSAWLRKRLDKQ